MGFQRPHGIVVPYVRMHPLFDTHEKKILRVRENLRPTMAPLSAVQTKHGALPPAVSPRPTRVRVYCAGFVRSAVFSGAFISAACEAHARQPRTSTEWPVRRLRLGCGSVRVTNASNRRRRSSVVARRLHNSASWAAFQGVNVYAQRVHTNVPVQSARLAIVQSPPPLVCLGEAPGGPGPPVTTRHPCK